ncbi:MAG: NOB1 family endonuclease [Actinomycetota bacterium]|nr:NOB1 family endonuclease [Actinomycetota bacterium]
MMHEAAPGDLWVLRCRSCGDTFTTESDAERRCRSCGSEEVDLADEPLL